MGLAATALSKIKKVDIIDASNRKTVLKDANDLVTNAFPAGIPRV